MTPKTLWRVYGLIFVLLLLTVYHIGLIVATLQQVTQASPQGWQIVTIGASLLWSGVFMWAAVGLWQQKRIHRRALMLMIGFVIYNGVRLTIFTQAEYERQRLPFVWVMTILMVVVLLLIRQTWTEHMETKEKDYDSKSKN